MKRILICILFLICFQSGYGQQARIQEYLPKFTDKVDAARFACNEADRQPGVGLSEIEFLSKDSILITNHTPSPALGGIVIKILLDSNLKVISLTYHEWADSQGGYERTISTESPTVLLNFNPFERGIVGLQGMYNFIIKTVYVPGEVLKSQGEEPSTGYRLFFGRFKCK